MSKPISPADWRKTRELVFLRDGGGCIECKSPLSSADAHIHHLIPRAFGGGDREDNLITLCDGCHANKHRNLQVSLGRRTLEKWVVRIARWLDRELVGKAPLDKLGIIMRIFGIGRLREGQLEAILAALRGESVLFVSPTGSGKSFCFQAPAMLQRGTTLVIAPLKALMSDQVGGLHKRRIPATFVNGDLSPDEKKLRYDLFRRGVLKFMYCAPERFDRQLVRDVEVREMEAARPTFFVVDEAHCIDKWGDAFRPSYRQLGNVRQRLGNPPILAFTATAGPSTQKRILSALGVPNAHVVLQDVDRPNIALLRLGNVGIDTRIDIVAEYLRALRAGSGGRVLIFVPIIKMGLEIKERLNLKGISAGFFHGKLRPKEREHLQARFDGRQEPPLDLMICTSAFGMGIDIPDVRIVFHWQHSASVEDYLQEFGRAGRDQKASLAVLFSSGNDESLLQFMLQKTLEAAALAPNEIASVRSAKLAAIKEINSLTESASGCFRDSIRKSLEATTLRKRSLALRLLELVYAGADRRRRYRVCCDVCARLKSHESKKNWGLRLVQNMKAR